jgi:hypothetical protein
MDQRPHLGRRQRLRHHRVRPGDGAVQSIIGRAREVQIDAAAGALREAVVNGNLLDGTLPSWVDLSAVNWTELAQSWAADAP